MNAGVTEDPTTTRHLGAWLSLSLKAVSWQEPGREAAIKTLPAGFAQDGNRLAGFEREAKLERLRGGTIPLEESLDLA